VDNEAPVTWPLPAVRGGWTWENVRNAAPRKYYYAGSVRVAMRDNGTLYFLLSDHLGSMALTLLSNGTRDKELRYKSYGDTRYITSGQKTNYRFTGQRWDQGHGLYWYNSRWFDPLIGRFMQADSIVPQPGNPQALNRYLKGRQPCRCYTCVTIATTIGLRRVSS